MQLKGTISDDGDAWVDKHSGYVITAIDYDTEEGYTEEGFKAKSRELLEADLGEALLQSGRKNLPRHFDSDDAERVFNVATAMATFMGLDIGSLMEFIIRSTIHVQAATMPSREAYDTAIQAAERRGKKNLDSYETVS